MIRSITLQNFKSFGEHQEVPLEPVTVLVGPNNSGKSSFMSVGRFMANAVIGTIRETIEQEGGVSFAFHRPAWQSRGLHLDWKNDQGSYLLALEQDEGEIHITQENLWDSNEGDVFKRTPSSWVDRLNLNHVPSLDLGLRSAVHHRIHEPIWAPIVRSRMVKLSLPTLRADSEVVPSPQLTQEGAGLAAVLGLWRGSQPEKCEELEAFLRKCLPEIRNALVRPAPVPGYQRLWMRQTDGEEFDAEHLSDGVLCFTALTMHAIDAGPGQLLFIEEPEHSIHPRRLRELVELLKELVAAKGCQFVIATHSPVLLNAFRDEPEAILLFRRSETGTKVRRLEDVPELKAALRSSPPGDMALVAIDNDGGSQRCPEHEPTHVAAQHGAGEEDCRVCWLGQRVPEAWRGEHSTHRAYIIVPVQTLETWLLVLRGHDFGDKRPEQTYDRPSLKKKFYGRPIPPSRRCTELALEQLRRPDALDILRARPSFQHFEQQSRSW